VPCPTHWGGYLVRPHTVEFWQGRRDRLHDRIRYRAHEGGWQVERLSP
jgi:pyridoxamine 5'-phosphate oxidase